MSSVRAPGQPTLEPPVQPLFDGVLRNVVRRGHDEQGLRVDEQEAFEEVLGDEAQVNQVEGHAGHEQHLEQAGEKKGDSDHPPKPAVNGILRNDVDFVVKIFEVKVEENEQHHEEDHGQINE